MPQTSRIPTPMKQHLHRFRLGVLPVIWFLMCVMLTLWLWERAASRGTVIGEVEAQQVLIAAGTEGILTSPTTQYWQVFDRVTKGQIIAMLDDSELQAMINTVKAEAAQLVAELEAEKAAYEADRLTAQADNEKERVSMTWEVERRRLEMVQIASEVKALRTELDGVEAGLQALEKLAPLPGVVRHVDLVELQREREALKGQLESLKPVYQEAKQQFELQSTRLAEFAPVELPGVEATLAPIRAGITVQERRIDELEVLRQKLIITAPMDGVISAINCWPGQHVAAGTPIMTIAKPDSQYIISYVRDLQRIPLQEGMQVGLRLRGQPGGPEYLATVKTIGPQVAPVPPQQLADPNSLEWATPIKIEIPSEMRAADLRPGQLVQVIFRHSATSTR